MNSTTPQAHQVLKLDLEQCARALLVSLRANVPAALWGCPGFAKSAIVEAAAQAAQRRLWTAILSYYEETDLSGMPQEHNNDSVRWLRPEMMPFVGNAPDDTRALLFLDEYDRATDRMQNATLQLLRERCIANHKLLPDCRLIIAGNAATDTLTSQLSEAASTRMLHLYLDATSERTRDFWLTWAEAHDIAPAVRAYARECWSEIAEFHDAPDFAQPTKPNLRTLEMVSDLLKAADDLDARASEHGKDIGFTDLIVPMLSGLVATGPAVKLYAMHRQAISDRSIDAILDTPETAPVSANGQTWLICSALMRRARLAIAQAGANSPSARETAEKVVTYARRLPDEAATWLMRDLIREYPNAASLPQYTQWANTQR